MNDLRLLHSALIEHKISFSKSTHSKPNSFFKLINSKNPLLLFKEQNQQQMAQRMLLPQGSSEATGKHDCAHGAEDRIKKKGRICNMNVKSEESSDVNISDNRERDMSEATYQQTNSAANSYSIAQDTEYHSVKTERKTRKSDTSSKQRCIGEMKNGKTDALQSQVNEETDTGAGHHSSNPPHPECDEIKETTEKIGEPGAASSICSTVAVADTEEKGNDITAANNSSSSRSSRPRLQKPKNVRRHIKDDIRPKRNSLRDADNQMSKDNNVDDTSSAYSMQHYTERTKPDFRHLVKNKVKITKFDNSRYKQVYIADNASSIGHYSAKENSTSEADAAMNEDANNAKMKQTQSIAYEAKK